MRASLGFTQNELYRKSYGAHKGATVFKDDTDGLTYAENCVQYFVRKVS